MPRLTFVSRSDQDVSHVAANTERLINRYPEPSRGSTAWKLRPVPGEVQFATVGGFYLRAMREVSGTLYVISQGNLYSVSDSGSATFLASVTEDENTSMSGMFTGEVTVAANGVYYVWDGSSLLTPTGGAFSSVGTVGFMDQRAILTELDGNRFQWSDPAAPQTLNGLYFNTLEADADKILTQASIGQTLWFFGTDTVEIWTGTGQAGADSFQRLSVQAGGILGQRLVTKHDAGLFWIGDDKAAYVSAGTDKRRVSTAAVNSALEEETPTHCYAYETRGHKFCVARFSDRPAWVYDLTLDRWHERSAGPEDGPWEVTSTVKAYGKWYSAKPSGQLAEMSGNTDIDGPIIRKCVSQPLYQNGNRFRVPALEVRGNYGDSDLGRDGKIMLRTSRDGRTFGPLKEREIGDQGEYGTRAVFRNLGQFRTMSIEVTDADNTELVLNSDVNVMVA